MKTYRVNEVFYSLQGEGVRAGTANIFIRFSGCNLQCGKQPGPKSPGGFDCDTEFASGRALSLEALSQWIAKAQEIGGGKGDCRWLILTGGEPGLQVDTEFVSYFKERGFSFAVETNGTVDLSSLALDWVTVSPKVAEHAVVQRRASEVKYVRAYGQGIPKTVVDADHYLISPAFDGGVVHPDTLSWCINLCLENPQWRLSLQQHKTWKVR